MNHTCDACGTSADHDASRGHIPPGWRLQRIERRVVTLCDSCSFLCPRDGASPFLLDLLHARGVDVGKPDSAAQTVGRHPMPALVSRMLLRMKR
jgi:hypothetical protein